MFSVIGNGKWGIAIATYLAKRFNVELIGRRIKPVNAKYIEQTTAWQAKHDVVIYAAPAHLAPMILTKIGSSNKHKTCLIFSKGLVCDGEQAVTTLYDYCRSKFKHVAVMQGPSFADELNQGYPTALVCAEENAALMTQVTDWFSQPPVLLQHSYDPIGVSIAGAFKNPVAMLMGYLDAAKPSANFRYAFLTYANQVLSVMIQAMGGNPLTAYGYAGQGDLLMTATTDLSRNRRFGQLLYKGCSAQEAKLIIGETIAGLDALDLLVRYCQAKGHTFELLNLVQLMTTDTITAETLMSQLIDLMQATKSVSQNAVV